MFEQQADAAEVPCLDSSNLIRTRLSFNERKGEDDLPHQSVGAKDIKDMSISPSIQEDLHDMIMPALS